ncbi:MAG TPA: GNAT family N-acetyltransferase [Gemmatimonadales bacterium]|nr:GNAT family N-acetyltransferase [Gemmatimonadales bacterium]
MRVRDAAAPDVDRLADIWYEGWRDAHLDILPPELARYRTRESFHERLVRDLPMVRVVGPPGAPLGFCMIRDDELYQLYVDASVRGQGSAAVLLADAEAQLAARGVETAWLACAIGNDRAARFYEKHGWMRAATVRTPVEIPDGVFPLEVWRYEKRLG